MSESKAHRSLVQRSLRDKNLQTALKRAISAYKKARAEAMAGFDLAASQDKVREIKERSISQMRELFERFKLEAERVGAVVHEAADGDQAARIVSGLAQERGVRLIVKSKSMLTEEIELNARLAAFGLDVVETDLGEWIIQLAGEKPSHFTAPAMHKTREQIAELFSEATGDDVEADVAKLVGIAREQLRQAFIDAQMGISGANIAIAETGGIVIVANEGNDRLVTTLPPIHVVIVGYEKLVASMDEATEILKVLARSGTGQKQTAYVSFITGPSRTTDIEKTLALGVHGPRELHIIFVDAGRTAMAADETCAEALYCIKCGACLNLCPAYQSVGGHAYGNAYMGGIGSVVTAFHQSLEAAEDTLELCAGCHYCVGICPSRIDTPGMVLELRKRLVERHGLPATSRLPLAVLRRPRLFQSAIRAARALQRPLLGDDGMLKNLPLMPDVGKYPGLASRSLRERLPERSQTGGTMTVSFYAGCMIDFLYPEIGEAIWKVLTGGGASAMFAKDQSCCGAPALYMGDEQTARKLAVDNILALETGSPSYVVTGCPTCAVMLKERFPMLLRGTAWEDRSVKLAGITLDFSQFAVDVLGVAPARTSEGQITYHDPCHQVRGIRTGPQSRELIRRSGLELVEMDEPDECCGFGGSYSIKQAGVSSSIRDRKIQHILESGAPILATDCPGCIMHIRGGLMKQGIRVEVCHTAQIVADLLG